MSILRSRITIVDTWVIGMNRSHYDKIAGQGRFLSVFSSNIFPIKLDCSHETFYSYRFLMHNANYVMGDSETLFGVIWHVCRFHSS